MKISQIIHLYSAPRRRTSRNGNILAHGISHLWIKIPIRKGGEGIINLLKHCREGRIKRNPLLSLFPKRPSGKKA